MKDSWRDSYFLFNKEKNQLALFVIIFICKGHHGTKHKSYNKYTPSERRNKFKKLKANRDRKQIVFTKEFIKKCMKSVVRVLFAKKRKVLMTILVSQQEQ